ncbi:MAG TPA: polyprenol monophosphomannose synthase [Nitrososphaerales archaeon]|nr:polyprenol monophosphomannose synthase [Nitrososphaerales archaeon]
MIQWQERDHLDMGMVSQRLPDSPRTSNEFSRPNLLGSRKLLCHVIPTFNEKENIAELIERTEKIVPNLPFDLVLIFVDDNSTDGTSDIIKSYANRFQNIRLIERPQPSGLGSAYMDAFAYSLSNLHADYLGEMDADLQHPPETLVDMCTKACTDEVDVVLASRYVKGGGSEGWSLGRRLISRGANLLSKVFLRVPVADSTTGFRVLSQRVVRALLEHDLSAKGYAFQVESLYVYKKVTAKFAEVPYSFGTRKAGKTKLDWKEVFRFASVTIRTGLFGVKKKKRRQ